MPVVADRLDADDGRGYWIREVSDYWGFAVVVSNENLRGNQRSNKCMKAKKSVNLQKTTVQIN